VAYTEAARCAAVMILLLGNSGPGVRPSLIQSAQVIQQAHTTARTLHQVNAWDIGFAIRTRCGGCIEPHSQARGNTLDGSSRCHTKSAASTNSVPGTRARASQAVNFAVAGQARGIGASRRMDLGSSGAPHSCPPSTSGIAYENGVPIQHTGSKPKAESPPCG